MSSRPKVKLFSSDFPTVVTGSIIDEGNRVKPNQYPNVVQEIIDQVLKAPEDWSSACL